MGIFGSASDKTSAGLFISNGVMQYVEIVAEDSGITLKTCIDMPYDIGSPTGDVFGEPAVIENNLRGLKRKLGHKWPSTVYSAVQSKDVLLRTVELPKMDLDDIKRSFRFEFDRYFPIPVDDAVYDIAFIDRPAQDDLTKGALAFCLASAVRRSTVENFMRAAGRVGIKLKAIEPAPVAGLRCMMGPVTPMGFNVYAIAGITSSMIISTYRDNGLVFRNTSTAFAVGEPDSSKASDMARDLQATINFSATQVRGFSPESIYIGGYGAGLGSDIEDSFAGTSQAQIRTVDPWDLWEIKGTPKDTYGWEIALGLALRHLEVNRP